MQSKFTSTVFAFVCGALVVAIAFGVGLSVANMQSASAAEPAAAVQQWEFLKFDMTFETYGPMLDGQYSTIEDASAAANLKLLNIGKEGWELVDVEYYETGGGYAGITVNEVYFFRRPLGASSVAG